MKVSEIMTKVDLVEDEVISFAIKALVEKEIDSKCYVRFGIRGKWSKPNYQVENESSSTFFTFYGRGLQKEFGESSFNDSNITQKRFSISELETALKDYDRKCSR